MWRLDPHAHEHLDVRRRTRRCPRSKGRTCVQEEGVSNCVGHCRKDPWTEQLNSEGTDGPDLGDLHDGMRV